MGCLNIPLKPTYVALTTHNFVLRGMNECADSGLVRMFATWNNVERC